MKNVDVTVNELRMRLKQGKIYKSEKIKPPLPQDSLSVLRNRC